MSGAVGGRLHSDRQGPEIIVRSAGNPLIRSEVVLMQNAGPYFSLLHFLHYFNARRRLLTIDNGGFSILSLIRRAKAQQNRASLLVRVFFRLAQ